MKQIDKNNLKISKEINFNTLTPENEESKTKLIGNLKNYIGFLKDDIFLNQNSIVIDMGANIGDITSIFARFDCKVYSFEPTKYTFDILDKRFSKNEKIKCYNKACWIKNEKIKFYHHEWSKYNSVHWSNGNSLKEDKTNINKQDFEYVEAIDISEFINNLETDIDLLKIDIEGAEIEVINHLIDTGIIHKIKKIVCEVHDKKYPSFKIPTNNLRKRIFRENLTKKINLDWH